MVQVWPGGHLTSMVQAGTQVPALHRVPTPQVSASQPCSTQRPLPGAQAWPLPQGRQLQAVMQAPLEQVLFAGQVTPLHGSTQLPPLQT